MKKEQLSAPIREKYGELKRALKGIGKIRLLAVLFFGIWLTAAAYKTGTPCDETAEEDERLVEKILIVQTETGSEKTFRSGRDEEAIRECLTMTEGLEQEEAVAGAEYTITFFYNDRTSQFYAVQKEDVAEAALLEEYFINMLQPL